MFVLILLSTFTLLSHQQLDPTEVAHVLPGQVIIKQVQTTEVSELAKNLIIAHATVETMQDVRNLFEDPTLVYSCDDQFFVKKHSDIFEYFEKAPPTTKIFTILDAHFLDDEKILFRLKEDGDQHTYSLWARKNEHGEYLIYGERCN